ncbi:MAG: tRNA lysidine(34) synthetase TilS [Odoribacter sp.]|nr:tRNA lysidine(34) synthetase TilS [Odoribacter sp.]
MLEEFRTYIGENSLVHKNDRILLAVSGGIDSMVMAHLFIALNTKTGIAHCNFNLRGRESDKDEAFVKYFAEKHNIPFYSERFDTTGYASEKGISIQMAARELRYKWFEEIRLKNDYSCISVAHNLNDNVETFLINLTRGTGIAGLTGMKPKHKNIIRPLLFASRNAIIDYSNNFKVGYREDSSNSEIKYTRNKIRHEIIPQFREINPSFETTIIETAERLSEINEIISGHITGIRENISISGNDETVFNIKALQELSPKRTLLYELFRPFGVGKGQLDDFVNLINSKTGSQLITSSFRVIKNRKELVVSKNVTDSESFLKISCIEDFIKFPGCISAEIKKAGKGFSIPALSNIACLDADKIFFPMVIRKWKHGDTFYPFGMKQKKKLSDYFVDNKYSVLDKEHCRILESEGNIVWLMNDRIDNRYRITPGTKKALIIEIKSSGKNKKGSYLQP